MHLSCKGNGKPVCHRKVVLKLGPGGGGGPLGGGPLGGGPLGGGPLWGDPCGGTPVYAGFCSNHNCHHKNFYKLFIFINFLFMLRGIIYPLKPGIAMHAMKNTTQ